MNNDKSRLVLDNFERAAPVYDKSPFFPLFGRRLVEVAEIDSGSRVLDIATGTGAVLFHLAEAVGPAGHVTGIDFAESMVARTATEITRRGLRNAETRRMNAEVLDFPDASFDAAVCGFALWFIPNMAQAISEAWRVLRPGGRFAVSTWCPPGDMETRQNQLLLDFGGEAPQLGSHVLTNADAVSAALTGAGFRVASAAVEEISVVYKDAEQWWDQRLANPQLNALTVPTPDQQRFKQAALALADEFKQPDGIHHPRKAVIAVGMKPG